VVTAVSFTSAFDASDDDAISSHSLLLRVARVYNQEEVDFLRRNAAANEKNANKQKIKERIFQRKEFFFSSFVEQRASTKKKIKHL
jgi:hypothetical protein